MVNNNHAVHGTNFTVSIEAAKGVTTGISANDRAVTIHAAVAPDAKPTDLVQPGHIFPLMAQPGGVLRRAGHTEAGCDLARLAGLEPTAVIVEILNEDGSMARRPDLEKFAHQHQLKIGTVADLIRFRTEHEKTVERIDYCKLPTEFGEFKLTIYQDTIDNSVHFALTKGQIHHREPILVRVHIRNSLCDLTMSLREECGWPLRNALKRIAEEGNGILVILQQPENIHNIINEVRYYCQRDQSANSPVLHNPTNLRTHGLGAVGFRRKEDARSKRT